MKRTLAYVRKSLIRFYSHQEIEAFISIIFYHIYNYSKNELILNDAKALPESDFIKIKEIVARLQLKEPIQYILGSAEFYSLTFKVTPDVLIPRGETEELVDLILKDDENKNLKVLDIGTGSGCIPISLKKNNPQFGVFSCDISEKALRLAEANAKQNNVSIQFFPFDILSDQMFPFTEFDLIVSNPPYVTNKEKALMDANVLEHEPHRALFVPDNDPLLFYRAIIQKSKSILVPTGTIYFEINEAYGNEVVKLLKNANFKTVLIKDLNGKDRIVKGSKN